MERFVSRSKEEGYTDIFLRPLFIDASPPLTGIRWMVMVWWKGSDQCLGPDGEWWRSRRTTPPEEILDIWANEVWIWRQKVGADALADVMDDDACVPDVGLFRSYRVIYHLIMYNVSISFPPHHYSLAPIGGLIEPGEEPAEAAKRELLEEAGLGK